MKRRIIAAILCACLGGCIGCQSKWDTPTGVPTTPTTSTTQDRPADFSEMRAVWFSFNDITDLLENKTADQAKTALDTAMKRVADFGLNTVIFHVRASSDAYYDSDIFQPAAAVADLMAAGFDPLAYAIQAAHQNGLQLHAWINPYRIGSDTAYAVSDDTFEDNGRYYYIPTSLEAQAVILNGVREVMAYDVDGLQFDDYFYPLDALEETVPADFEQAAYESYRQAGGTGTVGDWRRSHVSAFVRSVYAIVHQQSGRVFGISPSSDAGKNRDRLYADTLEWMAKGGYVDYMCPQIYYGFDNQTMPFDELVDTWSGYTRDPSVSLYVGLALYKTGTTTDAFAGSGEAEWNTHDDVMARSVAYLREDRSIGGFMLFRYAQLTANATRDTTFDAQIAQRELQHLQEMLLTQD